MHNVLFATKVIQGRMSCFCLQLEGVSKAWQLKRGGVGRGGLLVTLHQQPGSKEKDKELVVLQNLKARPAIPYFLQKGPTS